MSYIQIICLEKFYLILTNLSLAIKSLVSFLFCPLMCKNQSLQVVQLFSWSEYSSTCSLMRRGITRFIRFNIGKDVEKNDKSIEYVRDKSIVSILCSKDKIIIRIEDRKNNKETEVVIDNIVLQRYAMTVTELAYEIEKQSLHESRNKQHLLAFNDSSITLAFTYPKCQTKPITFKCNWKITQKSTIEAQRMLAKAHRTLENFDDMSRLALEKVAAYVDSRLSQTVKALTGHYNHLIKLLNDQMYQKTLEFDMMLSQVKKEQQERFNILLKEAIEKILDSNHRYYDQFRLMKTNIQTDILLCDQNIKEISNQVSDLRNFMMAEHEKLEDRIIKVSVGLENLQDNMMNKFKEIKSILLENATLQVDLKQKNLKEMTLFENIGNQTDKSSTSTRREGLIFEDKDQVKEDKLTQLPILNREQLSQLHLNQMYLNKHSNDQHT